jgi:hypothetical protein
MISSYIGLKYDLHNKKGLNCWALVAKVYSDIFGDTIPIYKSKSNKPSDIASTFNQAFLNDQHGFKKVEKPVDYCVAVFKKPTINGDFFHCGIYFQGKILHSSDVVGMVTYQSMKEASRGFKTVEFWQK